MKFGNLFVMTVAAVTASVFSMPASSMDSNAVCPSDAATIYVENGKIVGGPDDGKTYKGLLRGTNGDDIIHGTDGRDRVHAANGSDIVCGFAGKDDLRGGHGQDQLFGGVDDDKLFGNQDADQLYGGGGKDRLVGADGDDDLFGQAGADNLQGQADNDKLFGGADNDILVGGPGDDELNGGGDDDKLFGHNGNDSIRGGDGDDVANGQSGMDACDSEIEKSCESTLPPVNSEIALALSSGLNAVTIPMGSVANIAFVIDYTGDDINENSITFTQTVLPDASALSLDTGIPPGWTSVQNNSWVVNEVITANTAGEYDLQTTVMVAGTAIEATITTHVSVFNPTIEQGQLSLVGGDPGAVQLDTQSTVGFTVSWLGSDNLPVAVYLESVDANGQAPAAVGEMLDDGLNPDLIESDRVYSIAFDTNQSIEGELFFRARADLSSGESRYSNVTSIGVTRFPPEVLNTDIEQNTIENSAGVEVLAHRILVSFDEGTQPETIESIVGTLGATVVGTIWRLGVYQLEFSTDGSVQVLEDILAAFALMPNVALAEPIAISTITEVSPLDTRYAQQYYLPLVRADETWTIARGGALIAVLDTGVDYNHPDLDSKVIKGKNYTAAWFDVPNWYDPLDDHSHGTHVAGIAAAESNVAQGIAGVSWDSKVLAVKVCDMNGSCDSASTAAGIIYAADSGAKVINLSLGGYGGSSAQSAAITYAIGKGSMVIAAAGNDGCPSMFFPAAYSNALAVGATDSADNRSIWSAGVPACTPNSGSNFGPWVDIAAPGTSIHSTILNNGYGNKSGTSMATPVVAGAAAVVMSAEPSLSIQQVRDRLLRSAKPLSGANLGAGRLDLFEAVFNGSFEIGDLSGWEKIGTGSSLTELGPLVPQALNGHSERMGYVSTGPADAFAASMLSRSIEIQPGVVSIPLKFEYNFITEEYPEFVGTEFDDTLNISLRKPDGSVQALATESVNVSTFSMVNGIDFPGGDLTVGETGWKSVSTIITVTDGPGEYNIEVEDAGDEIYDSVLLIDNIRFK